MSIINKVLFFFGLKTVKMKFQPGIMKPGDKWITCHHRTYSFIHMRVIYTHRRAHDIIEKVYMRKLFWRSTADWVITKWQDLKLLIVPQSSQKDQ